MIERAGAAAPPPVLRAAGLTFAWPGQPPLLQRLNINIPPGVSWLGGDEGSGKTTLLRLLAGALQPQAGHVAAIGPVFWVDPRDDGCDALTPGACFERVASDHAALDRALLDDLVHALDLAPHVGKRLEMLSTGTRRKVWLAAAFASGASLTLLGQPFAALDKRSAAVVTELLQDAADSGTRAWVVADHVPPADVPLSAKLLPGG